MSYKIIPSSYYSITQLSRPCFFFLSCKIHPTNSWIYFVICHNTILTLPNHSTGSTLFDLIFSYKTHPTNSCINFVIWDDTILILLTQSLSSLSPLSPPFCFLLSFPFTIGASLDFWVNLKKNYLIKSLQRLRLAVGFFCCSSICVYLYFLFFMRFCWSWWEHSESNWYGVPLLDLFVVCKEVKMWRDWTKVINGKYDIQFVTRYAQNYLLFTDHRGNI